MSSVDAARDDLVADPDGWGDPDVAGDVGSNAIDVCAADFDASAEDEDIGVDAARGDLVADPDGWGDPEAAGDVGSNATFICAADGDAGGDVDVSAEDEDIGFDAASCDVDPDTDGWGDPDAAGDVGSNTIGVVGVGGDVEADADGEDGDTGKE